MKINVGIRCHQEVYIQQRSIGLAFDDIAADGICNTPAQELPAYFGLQGICRCSGIERGFIEPVGGYQQFIIIAAKIPEYEQVLVSLAARQYRDLPGYDIIGSSSVKKIIPVAYGIGKSICALEEVNRVNTDGIIRPAGETVIIVDGQRVIAIFTAVYPRVTALGWRAFLTAGQNKNKKYKYEESVHETYGLYIKRNDLKIIDFSLKTLLRSGKTLPLQSSITKRGYILC